MAHRIHSGATLGEHRKALLERNDKTKKLHPKVTIFTISLNAAETIERTVNSVFSQDYPNVEYIIVDGGSEDRTLDRVKSLDKSNACYLISDRDEGTSDAVNIALYLATGKYVCWVNADDWIEPSFISSAVRSLENTNAAFAHGDLWYISPDGSKRLKKGDPEYWKQITFKMPRLNSPSTVIDRSLFQKIGLINTTFFVANDYEWFLRLHSSGSKGCYCPEMIVHHTGGGISSKFEQIGYNEEKRAALLYSGSKALIWMSFLNKSGRRIVRNFLRWLIAHTNLSLR